MRPVTFAMMADGERRVERSKKRMWLFSTRKFHEGTLRVGERTQNYHNHACRIYSDLIVSCQIYICRNLEGRKKREEKKADKYICDMLRVVINLEF